jgi:glyoxylase-like metal-dependent hydrolase (beta-lactamase superfamily II)
MKEEPITESRVVVELGTESHPELIRFCTGQRPGSFGTIDGYALRTTAGWIFVDPVRPTPEGAGRLRRLMRARPTATVLTSDGHERFSHTVRRQWGIPAWGPALGEAQRDAAYSEQPNHLYTEGDQLPSGLRAIKLAGMWRGDHALLWQAPTGERVLFSGDILNGQVEADLATADHYRREPGLYFGARPGYVERHANRAALKTSLERLLQEEFDVIAGAHGRSCRDNPQFALARLIETI